MVSYFVNQASSRMGNGCCSACRDTDEEAKRLLDKEVQAKLELLRLREAGQATKETTP